MPVYMHRFALNIAQKHLVAGLFPDPLGSLRSSPRLPSWIKGEGRGGERKGRRGGREKKGGCYLPPFIFSGCAHGECWKVNVFVICDEYMLCT